MDTDGNKPQHGYSLPPGWVPAADTRSSTSLPHLCRIHQTPLELEERHVPPARPATQAEEGSSLHYTALLSKSAEGDMAVLIHVDTIAITAMP